MWPSSRFHTSKTLSFIQKIQTFSKVFNTVTIIQEKLKNSIINKLLQVSVTGFPAAVTKRVANVIKVSTDELVAIKMNIDQQMERIIYAFDN